MSAQRILMLYRLTFVALIIVASAQTMATESGHVHALVLATAEIAGAAALAWRRTQRAGAALLLLVFATAQIVSATLGLWPTHFLLYAASTLLIVLLDSRVPAHVVVSPQR